MDNESDGEQEFELLEDNKHAVAERTNDRFIDSMIGVNGAIILNNISNRAAHLYNVASELAYNTTNYRRRFVAAGTAASAVATTLTVVSNVATVVSTISSSSAFPVAIIVAGYVIMQNREEA